MTIIAALNEMKARGVTTLCGMHEKTNIDDYIRCAREAHEELHSFGVECAAEGIGFWQYELDHEDDHDLIDIDGHLCIITHYDGFDCTTYGDFDTDDEMNDAFHDWQDRKAADEIAREKVEQGSEMPYNAWYAVALHELKTARKQADTEFNAMFPATDTEEK